MFLATSFIFCFHSYGTAQALNPGEVKRLTELREGESHFQISLPRPISDWEPTKTSLESLGANIKKMEVLVELVAIERNLLAETDNEVRNYMMLTDQAKNAQLQFLSRDSTPLEKDEFETTSQFNERKKKKLEEYAKLKWDLDRINSLLKIANDQDAARKLLTRGTPVRLQAWTSDASYNADQGILRWETYTSYSMWADHPEAPERAPVGLKCDFGDHRWLMFHIPDIEKAKEIKEAIRSHIVFVGSASVGEDLRRTKIRLKNGQDVDTRTFKIVLHNVENIEVPGVGNLKSLGIEWGQ